MTSTGTSAEAIAEMNDIAPEIFLSILWPRFLAMEAGFPWYPTGRPKEYMYEKKIGMAATRPSMMSRVKIGIWRKNRKRAATEAAITAPTAANVVFIEATARYSSGRSLMCARRRLSSRSGSSLLRACTNFPNMRHATCCFGVRLTLTGFAPFGSFTMWCAFSVCSPGLNRFVFVSVPRVSSFSNALLPNRLTSGFDGLRDSGFRQSHLLADPLCGFVGVLVILDDDLRDLSEVGHPLLDHVVDNVDPTCELRLHLFVGHVLHSHDLVEQERASLVDELVRRGAPSVHRVRDPPVRPALADAGSGDAGDPVLVGQVDFAGVLDGDDLRAGPDEQGGAVQGGRLPGGGAAADHHGLAALDGDPEVGDHLRARGPELHQFDGGEGLLLVTPDGEGRPTGRHLPAVRRLDAMAFVGGPVQNRVRDGDLLRASLPEQDHERVQRIVVVEDDVRLDRLVLLVEDEERDARSVTGDVFDAEVRHEDVHGSVPDEIADDVVDDLVLRRGLETEATGLDERIHGFRDVFLLVLLRHLVPLVLERAVQRVLDHVEEFLLPRVEVGLPHVVDVLGSTVVVEDARVRERLADREDLHFLHRVLDQVRDRGQVGPATPRPFGLLLDGAPRHHHLPFPWHDSSTSELDLLRRVSDADLDLGVLEPEVADPHDAGVVVHREPHEVDLRRRVQGPTDLVDRLPTGYRGAGRGEGALGVRAGEFQCVREGLVEDPVP